MIPMIQLPIHKQIHRRKIHISHGSSVRPEVIQIDDSGTESFRSCLEDDRPIQNPLPHTQIPNLKALNPVAVVTYQPSELCFLEIPTIQLSEEFLRDPYRLIDDLYAKQYDKVGIVKLVAPALSKNIWKTLRDRLKEKRLVTRRQTLNRLTQGKPFLSNTVGYSLTEFCEMAQQFEVQYRSQTQPVADTLRQNELEFWSIVDNPDAYSPVEVEYAADLLVCKYASAFGADDVSFNLNTVNKMKNAMFQVLTSTQEMSGISVPWLYLGMKFASFCWHCEDLFLSSLNYMHAGAPKTWYAIPPSNAERFHEVFASKHDLKNNPRLLYDITTMISPIELQRKGVKILRTDQKPGELILTFGGTYHAGFSHGLNCSEAVNIAPTQWLAEHAKAVELYRRHGNCRKVSFPLEWLVIKILTKIDQTHFSQPHLEQIRERFRAIRKQELQFRQAVIKLYPNIVLYEFKNQEERYDKNICQICTDYMFLSYLFCNKCLAKGCLHHQSICLCLNQKMCLYQRFNEQQLYDIEARVSIF